jgi:peptide/nickel transport system permease protein
MTGRLLQFIVTLAAVSFAVYALIGLMPGDPVDLMIAGNPHMTPEDAVRLRAIHGLDQPLLTRYLHWATAALSGDMGYSRLYHVAVLDVIWPRLWNTIILLGVSLSVTLAIALPLGVYAAEKRGSMTDRVINVTTLAGLSVPPFWLGLLLIVVFAVQLGWLPAGSDPTSGITLRGLALPVATLAIANLAAYTRHLRAAMTEALAADHIRTARAKGCSDSRVLWHHAFKNALPPVVTLLMLDIGTLVGGAVTIETVFAFPGMGKLMFDAVMGNDYNLALCGFLILTAMVLLTGMLGDFLYRVIDPRQRAKQTDKKAGTA